MKTKKFFIILLSIIVVLPVFATGCNASDSGIPPVEDNALSAGDGETPIESDEPPVKDNSRISFIVQEYKGDNIAEIPYIEYDGEMNPEIESINRLNNQGIRQIYEEFISSADERRWIEIRSYPFTSEDYLQVVVTYCEYPIYGTDGNIYSVNYDRKAGKSLTANDIMLELGLDPKEVEDTLVSLLYPEGWNQLGDGGLIKGFLLKEDTDGRHLQLLLEASLEIPGAEPWKTFYAYDPVIDELYQLDKNCLFDPNDMDRMDPPLSYELAGDGA